MSLSCTAWPKIILWELSTALYISMEQNVLHSPIKKISQNATTRSFKRYRFEPFIAMNCETILTFFPRRQGVQLKFKLKKEKKQLLTQRKASQ